MAEGDHNTDRVVTISHNHDLTITVIGPKNKDEKRISVKFNVDEEALTSKSEYFAKCLQFNRANGHGSPKLQDDDTTAMHIWFHYMHKETAFGPKNALSKINISTIWHFINAADKYLFSGDLAKAGQEFFSMWYDANVDMRTMNADFARSLALPCYFFDHAKGFAEITRWLVYNNPGHVSESKPVNFKWKHLHLCPPDFVGPMNHARGRLKTVIHKELYTPVSRIYKSCETQCTCNRWPAITGRYFKALHDTKAWPLEMTFARNCVYKILDQLEGFSMSTVDSDRACSLCRTDWTDGVMTTRYRAGRYFDGLCLDCMDKSKFKRDNPDQDYWKHLQHVDGKWDTKCRITHGEPSWYVSWCGRDEHRQKLLSQKEEAMKPRYLY